MIEMNIAVENQRYVLGEVVQIRLDIANNDAENVSVPDPFFDDLEPEYILTLPDGLKKTGNHRCTKPGDRSPFPHRKNITIASKSKWSELIPLTYMFILAQTGKYKIQVSMKANQEAFLSNIAEFELVKAQTFAFAVAPASVEQINEEIFINWASAQNQDITVVQEVRLGKKWENDQIGKLYTVGIHRAAPLMSVAVPTMTVPRGMDFKNWIIWSEGNKIQMQRTEGANAIGGAEIIWSGNDQADPIERLVMDANHNLQLFAIEKGKTCALLHASASWNRPTQLIKSSPCKLSGEFFAAEPFYFQTGNQSFWMVFILVKQGSHYELQRYFQQAAEQIRTVSIFPPINSPAAGHALSVSIIGGGVGISISVLLIDTENPDGAWIASTHLSGKHFDKAITTRNRIPFFDIRNVKMALLEMLAGHYHVILQDSEDLLWYLRPKAKPFKLDIKLSAHSIPKLMNDGDEIFLVFIDSDGGLKIENLSRIVPANDMEMNDAEEE